MSSWSINFSSWGTIEKYSKLIKLRITGWYWWNQWAYYLLGNRKILREPIFWAFISKSVEFLKSKFTINRNIIERCKLAIKWSKITWFCSIKTSLASLQE
jgi:hypothetical protein